MVITARKVIFATMLRLVYIVFISLCSYLFGQGAIVVADRAEGSEYEQKQIVANRYTEQLVCAHRCNNTAQRSESISVPATSSILSLARTQHHRVDIDSAPIPTIASKSNFSIRFSLYRICCSRVIDYYLYTLCCLRL